MIDRKVLLSDLQSVLRQLETDLIQRSSSADVPEVGAWLQTEFAKASEAKRTAQNYTDWLNDYATQVAAAWVLSCVFARFLEDNGLYETPMIAGTTDHGNNGNSENNKSHDSHTSLKSHHQPPATNHLQRAKDERELYFRQHPGLTDRDYLLHVFQTLRDLKGGIVKEVFGGHNPVNELPNWLGPDAAGILLRFFQQIDPNTGDIRHDFTQSSRHSPSAAASAQADGTRSVPAAFDTRFLGDLYQDLSEAARKKYALLQTPEFVEEFILDRTLDPALDEFGLTPSREGEAPAEPPRGNGSAGASPSRFKMIDPACGSGHFLLGTFPRILNRWQRQEPGTNVRELVQRTLDSIHGVDINPFAIAIARFRLLLAAMRACGVTRLIDAPAFRMNLVCGDSLLHAPLAAGGKKYTAGQQELDFALASDPEDSDECDHAYRSENLPELKRLLRGGQYHAVVANPPYIAPNDRQLNERYRHRFRSCHGKYSLTVPFLERIFRLAVGGGYTGQITGNAFMKAEFGKKLIESFFPRVDLTHVIDASGAYIPGHGTPTVILFGRYRPPVASTLRTVMGIRGEPATPDDAAIGLVWSAIVAQLDEPGSKSEFVSVGDSPREMFHKHPWSIGGGGAAELKECLDKNKVRTLGAIAAIGIGVVTLEDDAFELSGATARRVRILPSYLRGLVVGDAVRDWAIDQIDEALFPHDRISFAAVPEPTITTRLWPLKTSLCHRIWFHKTQTQRGLAWFEYGHISKEKFRTPLSIVLGFVASHNHFVLDRGGKVFNRTAPVIKLPATANEDDHLALLGLLNSSTVCFWMKQVCFPKGGDTVGSEGARVRQTLWDIFYNFNSTPLARLPLPDDHPLGIAKQLDLAARQLGPLSPANVLRSGWMEPRPSESGSSSDAKNAPLPDGCGSLRESLVAAQCEAQQTRSQMIAAQEELDWECYRLYGLIAAPTERQGASRRSQADEEPAASALRLTTMQPPPLKLGQRAFEIVLARKMAQSSRHTPCAEANAANEGNAADEANAADGTRSVPATFQTTWFERHGSTPITELPADWPDDYRQLVERRIDLIASDPNIRLIEQPEYKRRWNTEPWDTQLERALREWLLDRLESYFDFDGRMADGGQGTGVGDQGESQEGVSENRKLKTENLPALAAIQLYSIAKLADVASKDADFMQVAELYRDDPAFNVLTLVEELVNAETVPLLPILRYKDTGLRKRAEWEKTWELQREEDRTSNQNSKIENQKSPIPVPPKYDSKDFLNANYWRLRGKLDVPKERWISFPGAEAEDGSLMIAWAGYDHLQQAQAISAWYVEIRDQQGGHNDKRLIPLLACLLELLPWIKQWHNSSDNEFNMSMADFFEGFLQEEARQLPRPAVEPAEPDGEDLFPDAAAAITYGWSLPEIQVWKPSARKPAKRAAKKAAKKSAAPKKAAKKRGRKTEED